MANLGTLSPLQLTAGYGLLQNQGISLGENLTANIAAYESTLVGNLITTVSLAQVANVSAGTIQQLETLGASVCAALGDSTPTAYADTPWPVPPPSPTWYLIPAYSSLMFSGEIANIGNIYLGSGDVGKFTSIFTACNGYSAMGSDFVLSAINANTYLGPTYNQTATTVGNMDYLFTGDLGKVCMAFQPFGEDLAALGDAINLSNLANFGTPAALLQQINTVSFMQNGTLPSITLALHAVGLTDNEIADLVNNNVVSYDNPEGLPVNEFNSLQQRAYRALQNITGTDLAQVLTILGITTPNINTMADLLNLTKLLPNSYQALVFSAPTGPLLIYNTDGSVNNIIQPIIDNNVVAPWACEELSKIIPSAQAVANKAFASSLQQVKGIQNVGLRDLAAALVA